MRRHGHGEKRESLTEINSFFNSSKNNVIKTNYIKSRNWLIAHVGRVFANGPGGLVSIPGRVIPKTLKIVLDTSLINTQQHKVCIKGKVEQSRERSSALSYTLV